MEIFFAPFLRSGNMQESPKEFFQSEVNTADWKCYADIFASEMAKKTKNTGSDLKIDSIHTLKHTFLNWL